MKRTVIVTDAEESPEKFAEAIIGLAAAERAETISWMGGDDGE